jgi:transposase
LQDYYRDYAPFIRLDGQPPIGATLYEQEIFRCSGCTRCFTAKLPAGVPPEKYAPAADATIVLYRYGFFVPFNRLANIQKSYGVPLAASVQWQRAEVVANCLLPIFLHMQLLAARGETLYHDDTGVRILRPLPPKQEKRTGLFTTGMVIEYGEWKIALYQSGRKHAGENAAELLAKRPQEMAPINKMSDGSNMNNSPKMTANLLNCLTHARAKFKKIEGTFTEACQHVIANIAAVYDFDEQTATMTKEQRLEYHKKYSLPIMEKLRQWMVEQFEEKVVEPNDALGCAFDYFLDRFAELTQFTRILGAPLDNNICERILRLVVLHRNNSLFYRNDMGAFVGDICMSVISTCRLNQTDAYQYLLTIIENARACRAEPENFLPWNYALNRQPAQQAVVASLRPARAPTGADALGLTAALMDR